MIQIAYHGTVIDRPFFRDDKMIKEALMLNGIDLGKNDLKAFFLSENQKACEFFSRLKYYDSENQLQAVIRFAINDELLHHLDLGNDYCVDFGGIKYDYNNNCERSDLYYQVAKSGKNGVVVSGNYSAGNSSGSDIAIFNPDVISYDSIRLRINNKWTSYLDSEKAISIVGKWIGFDDFNQANMAM